MLVAAGSPVRLDRMLGGPPAPPPPPPPPTAPLRRRRRSLTPPPMESSASDSDDDGSVFEPCEHDAVPSAYSSVFTDLQI